MKPVILLLVLFFIINGLVLAEESTNPAEMIIGKWQTEDKSIYAFTRDNKEVFVNNEKYATYRFMAKTLYLKYIVSGDEFETGVQFEDDKMILTEYKNRTNEKTIILKQVPR